MWAAAAAAPTAEAPIFSTATPMPASAHAASASHSAAPSPACSIISATDRSSGSVARWASQSAVVTTVSLPDEMAVWRRSPRRVPSALTTRLPLWETSPTCPGCIGASASPQSAAREWSEMSPSQLGPQTGSECRSAAARSSASRVALPASRKPAREDDRSAAPSAPASSMTAGTFAAGTATTTASGAAGRSDSVGKHSNPWTDERPGLTAHTSPSNPAAPEVDQGLGAVRLPALGRAHDGDRSRVEEPREVHRQWSVRSTPRRSSARATIRRWISLVPSQIRSTRSSRRKRSATLVRR